MTVPLKWTPDGKFCMRSAPWVVAKYIVNGMPKYLLWRDNVVQGQFESFEQAAAAVI